MAPKPIWNKTWSEVAEQVKGAMTANVVVAEKTYFCFFCGMFIFKARPHWRYLSKVTYRFHKTCMRIMETYGD